MKLRGITDAGMKRVAQQFNEAGGDPNYLNALDILAQDLKTEFLAGDIEDMHARVSEEVDGSEWVIYYAKNLEVLDTSANDEALLHSGIELDASLGWRQVLAQFAYFAMDQDLWDALNTLGWEGDAFEGEDF